jgi:hypothetical protein
MKQTYFILVLVFTLSCNKDNKCDSSLFNGEWKGPKSCHLTQSTVTVRLSSISSSTVRVNAPGIDGLDVERCGCKLSFDNTALGIGQTLEGNLSSDGTKLTFTHTREAVLGSITKCTYDLNK